MPRALAGTGAGIGMAWETCAPGRPGHQSRSTALKAHEPGCIDIDLEYLPKVTDECARRHLRVAMTARPTGGLIRVFRAGTATDVRRLPRDPGRACPLRIRRVPTDKGKEFTDRRFDPRNRGATGEQEFDALCAALDIEHRLTPPKSPRTDGLAERRNGRIEDVPQRRHFRSGEGLETTLRRHVRLCNQQFPQSAPGSRTPLRTMKDWHKLKPELFRKQPFCLPGGDIGRPLSFPTVSDGRTSLAISSTTPERRQAG